MIISDSKKFVFMHVPKTGGTSLAYNLCRYSRNIELSSALSDVVDTLDELYPHIEAVDVENHARLSEETHKWYDENTSAYFKNMFYKKNPDKLSWMNLFHHRLAMHPIPCDPIVNAEKYNDYFKFAFVRNPWDYVISVYKNKVIDSGVNNVEFDKDHFNEFIRNLKHYPLIVNNFIREERNLCRYLMNPDGTFIPDKIYRYEDYDNNMDDMFHRLDIVPKSGGVRLNDSRVRVNYKTIYENDTAEIIGDIFKDDIDVFGYAFWNG
jgi:hypothetical protein